MKKIQTLFVRRFENHRVAEGLVFWKDGEPRCKIKRSDFGCAWPVEEGANK